jgi:hypothetical protein
MNRCVVVVVAVVAAAVAAAADLNSTANIISDCSQDLQTVVRKQKITSTILRVFALYSSSSSSSSFLSSFIFVLSQAAPIPLSFIYSLYPFLGAFANLGKATLLASSCMSVCESGRMEQFGFH